MNDTKDVYQKVKIGADSDKNQTRIWLKGTIKEIIAGFGDKALTKKPKAVKAPKVKAAKKAKAAKKNELATVA